MMRDFYERALLSYFQFLYKYPKDELEMAAYFQIAKCYESLESWGLAQNYYNRILEESPPGIPCGKYGAISALLYNVNQRKIWCHY